MEGRLATTPELKVTKNGNYFTSFLIFNNKFTQEVTDERPVVDTPNNLAIPCVTFDRQAENLCKYGKKGMIISVVGKIEMARRINQDGYILQKLFVNATNVNFLYDHEREEKKNKKAGD